MSRVTTTPDQILFPAQPSDSAYVEAEDTASGTVRTTGQRVRDFITGPYPTLVSRFVLGGTLVFWGLVKLGDRKDFADHIGLYQLGLPQNVINSMASALPVLELGLGIWLLAGLFTRFAAAAGGLLLIGYMAASGQALVRGLEAECGCNAALGAIAPNFGQNVVSALGPVGSFLSDAEFGPIPIVRDLVLLLLALHLVLVPTIFAIDRLRQRGNRVSEIGVQ